MRKYLGTVALVVVFCGLLGLLLWNRARPPGPGQEAQAPAPVEVYRISDKDLEGVELLPSGVKLSRGPGGAWQLQDAPDLPLDQGRLDLLMTMLCKLEAERRVAEPGADPAQFGLDDPQVQARLALAGGGARTVSVGDEVPVKGAFYCSVSGSGAVYTLASHWVDLLKLTRDDLRLRALAGFDPAQVARFSLYASGSLKVKASRLGETAWAMETPWPCVTDPTAVQAFLTAFSGLRAEQFPCDRPGPQDLQGFGLDQPRLRLEFSLKGGGSGEVRVGRSEGQDQAYVQGASGPWVFLAKLTPGLETEPFQLLDRRLLPFEADKVERLEIAWGTSSWAGDAGPAWPGGEKAAMQRKGQVWELAEAPAGPAGGQAKPGADQLLSLAASLEWLFAGGAAAPADLPSGPVPALGLKARWTGGESSAVLLEGGGGRWYGRLGRSGPAVWVEREALEFIRETFPGEGK